MSGKFVWPAGFSREIDRVAEAKKAEILSDDYRPGRDYLSNGEIEATGLLCGGAVQNIARELLKRRKGEKL